MLNSDLFGLLCFDYRWGVNESLGRSSTILYERVSTSGVLFYGFDAVYIFDLFHSEICVCRDACLLGLDIDND